MMSEMKKKIIMALLLVLIPASIFASVLQMGGSVSWGVPIYGEREKPFEFSNIDLSSYDVGLDVRLNIPRFQLQGEVRGAFSSDLLLDSYEYNLAASTRFDVFFLDLTLGAGINISVDKDPVTKDWWYNGQSGRTASDVFSTAELYYRAGLGIDFGKMSLEMQATVPTGANWANMNQERMQSVFGTIGPKFERMRLSIGLTANFF